MKHTRFRRITSSALAAVLVLSMAPAALAESSPSSEASAEAVDAAKRENTYSAYLKRYADAARPNEEVTVLGRLRYRVFRRDC